jgi:type II secretory pathway component GspD/PulD (secretin)
MNQVTQFAFRSDAEGTHVTLTGTQPFAPDIRPGRRGYGTIITLSGQWRAGRAGSRRIGKNGIDAIQYRQITRGTVRIVASARRKVEAELVPSADRRRWEVILRTVARPALPAVATAPTIVAEPVVAPVVVSLPRRVAIQPPADATAPTHPVLATDTGNGAPMPRTLTAAPPSAPSEAPPQIAALTATPALPLVGRTVPSLETLVIAALPGLTTAPAPRDLADISLPAMPLRDISATEPSIPAPPPGKPAIVRIPATRPARVSAATPKGTSSPPPPQALPLVATVAQDAKDEWNPQVGQRLVTLDFAGADITDILKAISAQSGVNVVAGDDVKGKTVTLTLKKVPLLEALDWVAKLSGFRYARFGNTFVVGTGANIAALRRGPSVGEAVSMAVPFYYSDGSPLVESIKAAFPNANVTLVGVSAESKLVDNNTTTAPTNGSAAAAAVGSATSTVKLTPRGGVMNVVGTLDEVEQIRQFVEETERALVQSSQRQAQADALRRADYITENYTVKYSKISDLVELLQKLVPLVEALSGPAPSFVATPTGQSTSSNGGGSTGGSSSSNTPDPNAAVKSTTLILSGPPAEVKRALTTLEKLDVKVPMLIFEAKVIDINSSDAKDLGLDYNFGRTVTVGEKNFGDAPEGIGAGTGAAIGRVPKAGAIFRTPYTIDVQLKALVEQEKARILASPNLTALNGNQAVGFVGDQIKYVTNVQQTPQGTNVTSETLQVGITLKVKGLAKPDGTIELYVHPEVSSITSFLSIPGTSISLPQVSTRYADTMVRVKDGETIALGGLIRESDIDNIKKIPGLGDLPFLGQLFRSNSRIRRKSEVVILITSRIAKE